MRVICPYLPGMLHPRCVAALDEHAPGRVLVRLPADMDAYWQVFADQWARGVGFVVVEHDIVIHPGVVPGFAACPEPWCVHPYPGPGGVELTRALGCVRFSTDLIRDLPGVADEVGRVCDDGLPARDWRRLDVRVALALQGHGYSPHQHRPPVGHAHTYREGAP